MKLLSLSLIAPAAVVLASKDTRYYAPGTFNPNMNSKYYWKNSLNVMQDLDQFESLYVQYHGCVWSRYGFGDGCNDVGQANADDDEKANEAYWYLRRTMCFRANVAYTLYGTLKGDSDKGCHKDRYIKSFFTEWGPESFAQPLGLDTSKANSKCNAFDHQRWLEGDQIYGDDAKYSFQDDDEWKSQYEFPGYSDNKMSYTTGCSESGKFVLQSYQGSYCDGNSVLGQLDSLEDFNEEIEALGCTQIYNAEEGNNANNQQPQENRNEDEEDLSFDEPISIVINSQACLLDQYPTECPDPHGKLKKYTQLLNSGTQGQVVDRNKVKLKRSISWVLTALSVCLVSAAMFFRQSWKKKLEPGYRRRRPTRRTRASSKKKKNTKSTDVAPEYKPPETELTTAPSVSSDRYSVKEEPAVDLSKAESVESKSGKFMRKNRKKKKKKHAPIVSSMYDDSETEGCDSSSRASSTQKSNVSTPTKLAPFKDDVHNAIVLDDDDDALDAAAAAAAEPDLNAPAWTRVKSEVPSASSNLPKNRVGRDVSPVIHPKFGSDYGSPTAAGEEDNNAYSRPVDPEPTPFDEPVVPPAVVQEVGRTAKLHANKKKTGFASFLRRKSKK